MQNFILVEKHQLELLISELRELKELVSKKGSEPENDLIGVSEVAKLLKVDTQSIYQKVCNRKIPFMKQGKKLLFSKSEIMEWLKQTRHKTLTELENEANNYIKNGGNYEK